jgi:hypothetical protein
MRPQENALSTALSSAEKLLSVQLQEPRGRSYFSGTLLTATKPQAVIQKSHRLGLASSLTVKKVIPLSPVEQESYFRWSRLILSEDASPELVR